MKLLKVFLMCVLGVVFAGCATAPPPPMPAYRSAPAPAPKPVRTVYIPDDELPVVMLLIDEKNLGTIPTGEVEALVTEILMDERMQVVDQEMVRANLKKNQKLFKMAGDPRAAASLGLQFGANVVLSGSAVAKPAAGRIGDSKLRSYEAVVTLRAIDTDTSRALASASETATIVAMEEVTGGSKALKTAAKKTMEKLIPRMLTDWSKYGSIAKDSDSKVVMTVGGVDQVWKLKAIREKLKGRQDLVGDVVQKSYTAGVVVFEVSAKVPSEELAEQMILSAPRGLKMQVLDVGESKINLRAVAR